MSNVVDIRSFRGETWGASVSLSSTLGGEPVATLGWFWGADGREVPDRCVAFASALEALAAQLRETAVMCGGAVDPATGPVEWRYLLHGKGNWKHVYNAEAAGKLYAENAALPIKRRNVIEPLFVRPSPPKDNQP